MLDGIAKWIVALVLLGVTGCSGNRSSEAGEKKTPTLPLVRVSAVEVRQVRREVETTAFLEAEHRVTVYSKVTGSVEQVAVDEGQRVTKGQVLAQLDRRDAESSLRQVEVQIAERKVRLELSGLEREAAGQRVEQARIERDRAAADHQRWAEMDPALVAPKTLADAKSALDSAERALQIATFNQRKSELDIKAAQSVIDELEARRTDAAQNLAEHQILSPMAGVVVQRGIKGGERIGLATELFVVTDPSNLIAYLSRPQRELSMLSRSKEVLFTTDAAGDRSFQATVDLISPVVDQATGSFKMRMRVKREDAESLRPGMFVRARIVTEAMRDALMVPKTAVLAEGDRSILFTVRDGVARRVLLDPGLEERFHVECKNRGDDGLQPSDVVVIGGQEDLKDQSKVEIGKG